MPVGATVAAVGGVASAGIGALGAKSAAKTEAAAANRAAEMQQQMYQQTRSDLGGYRDFGASALSPYAKLLGISGGSGAPGAGPALAGAFTGTNGVTPTGAVNVGDPDYAAYVQSHPDLKAAWEGDKNAQAWFGGDMAAWGKYHYEQGGGKAAGYALPSASTYQAGPKSEQQSMLEAIPGYQFMRDQGIQSVNRSLGSRGLTGAQAKGIARFVTGLADSTYGEQVGRMKDAVTIGANAAAGTGQIGQGYANSIGGNIVGAGQASAAGTVGAANAAGTGISSATNAYLASKMLGMYGGGGVPVGGWSGG